MIKSAFNKTYRKLRENPPIIKIKQNAKEVILKTISCMCDNVETLSLKKGNTGEFKLDGNGSSLNNWQMKHDRYEIEWAADGGEWDTVVKMINTGTSAIESARSR